MVQKLFTRVALCVLLLSAFNAKAVHVSTAEIVGIGAPITAAGCGLVSVASGFAGISSCLLAVTPLPIGSGRGELLASGNTAMTIALAAWIIGGLVALGGAAANGYACYEKREDNKPKSWGRIGIFGALGLASAFGAYIMLGAAYAAKQSD